MASRSAFVGWFAFRATFSVQGGRAGMGTLCSRSLFLSIPGVQRLGPPGLWDVPGRGTEWRCFCAHCDTNITVAGPPGVLSPQVTPLWCLIKYLASALCCSGSGAALDGSWRRVLEASDNISVPSFGMAVQWRSSFLGLVAGPLLVLPFERRFSSPAVLPRLRAP